jgi:transcriptional regulator with XRE-family HTH domain
MTFGDKLRVFCVDKWGSLKDAAKELGVHQPNLSDYINNKSEPRASFLAKLLNAGCDLNWLLSEKEPVNAINESKVEYFDERAYLEEQVEKLKNEIRFLRGIINSIKIQATSAEAESKEKVPVEVKS